METHPAGGLGIGNHRDYMNKENQGRPLMMVKLGRPPPENEAGRPKELDRKARLMSRSGTGHDKRREENQSQRTVRESKKVIKTEGGTPQAIFETELSYRQEEV